MCALALGIVHCRLPRRPLPCPAPPRLPSVSTHLPWPQLNTWPPSCTATLCFAPAATHTSLCPSKPCMRMGAPTRLNRPGGAPSCPLSFRPQAICGDLQRNGGSNSTSEVAHARVEGGTTAVSAAKRCLYKHRIAWKYRVLSQLLSHTLTCGCIALARAQASSHISKQIHASISCRQ